MAHQIKATVWTSRLTRLSYAALLVMVFGLSVAAQAQAQGEEPRAQAQDEEAQAQDQDEEQAQDQDEEQAQEQDEEAQVQEPAEEAQAQEPTEVFTEAVVVVGVRESLTQAVEIKRDAIPMVDALVAEDIGKFPDNNVVESMQRIPGVQATNRGGGEVSTVSIRGLADVTTTVNGRNVFTSSGRAVALADIPATLVNRVDVYKTRSPENIARGIAGGIDIHTFRPFDFAGYTFSGSARGIYQQQAGEADPNVSVLGADELARPGRTRGRCRAVPAAGRRECSPRAFVPAGVGARHGIRPAVRARVDAGRRHAVRPGP
jgi:hypothetical protein